MNRRLFLKSTVLSGISLISSKNIFAAKIAADSSNDVFITSYEGVTKIEGGEPSQMFRKGIKQMGGISKFISKGDKVCIKPTIEWDASELQAANTNPQLVAEIIKQCFGAGASEVTLFDNTIDYWKNSYTNSGILKAAQKAGAKVLPANMHFHYKTVSLPHGLNINNIEIHHAILEADKWINVPILKHHSRMEGSVSKRNLMGAVWNRHQLANKDWEQSVSDISTYAKLPILNVVDAYRVITKRGPKGGDATDVTLAKALFISQDMDMIDRATSDFLKQIQ